MMALLAQQVVWGYVVLEKGIPTSSESFLRAVAGSPLWGGAGSGQFSVGPAHEGFISPFAAWMAPFLFPAAWAPCLLWASPSPSGLLQKATAGQRLPTDLHNCTVP